MKASELIKELEEIITTEGDLPIYKDSEYEEYYTHADIEIDYVNVYEERELGIGRRGKEKIIILPKRIKLS